MLRNWFSFFHLSHYIGRIGWEWQRWVSPLFVTFCNVVFNVAYVWPESWFGKPKKNICRIWHMEAEFGPDFEKTPNFTKQILSCSLDSFIITVNKFLLFFQPHNWLFWWETLFYKNLLSRVFQKKLLHQDQAFQI